MPLTSLCQQRATPRPAAGGFNAFGPWRPRQPPLQMPRRVGASGGQGQPRPGPTGLSLQHAHSPPASLTAGGLPSSPSSSDYAPASQLGISARLGEKAPGTTSPPLGPEFAGVWAPWEPDVPFLSVSAPGSLAHVTPTRAGVGAARPPVGVSVRSCLQDPVGPWTREVAATPASPAPGPREERPSEAEVGVLLYLHKPENFFLIQQNEKQG